MGSWASRTKPPSESEPQQLLPPSRRIVTGHDRNGNAIIQHDSEIASQATEERGLRGAPFWVTKEMPTCDNNDDEDGASRRIDGRGLVMKNGTNHRYTDLAPGAITPMHRTSSVDFNVLVQGELVLILEDGTERHLRNPGDVVVQRGTMHAWRNPGADWCRWVSVLVDAGPAMVDGRALEEAWISNSSA